MSTLPSGWVDTALGELAGFEPNSITDGPFGSNLKTAHYTGSGPRVIRLGNIGDGKFIDEQTFISEDHYETLIRHAVATGDIVVASLGTELPRSFVVPPWLPPAIVKADCIRVRLHPEVEPRYVNFFLNSPQCRGAASDLIHGVGRPRLGLGAIRELRVPLAPLAEQRRIVDTIEAQFSRLDTAETSLARSLKRLGVLRGELLARTIDWRGDLVPIEQIAAVVPHALAIGPFGSNLKVADYRDAGVPLIFVRNIRSKTFDGPDPKFVSIEKAASLASHTVRSGDVLVTKMGDPPGDVAIYPDAPDAILTADCIKITPRHDVDPRYLAAALESRPARRQVLQITKGVAQLKVSLGRFKSEVRIPIPEPAEQLRLIAEIERQASIIAAMTTAIQSALGRSAALRRAVLERAFAGELVPQDHRDESAARLLQRIAAARTHLPRPRRASAQVAARKHS